MTALLDSVSHDLRTPLASIRAAAGNLMDQDVKWSPNEQREVAATIDMEAERLNELVSNLLDMSRIQAGQLVAHPELFSLLDIVREGVARRRDRLAPRRWEIQLDAGLPPCSSTVSSWSRSSGTCSTTLRDTRPRGRRCGSTPSRRRAREWRAW